MKFVRLSKKNVFVCKWPVIHELTFVLTQIIEAYTHMNHTDGKTTQQKQNKTKDCNDVDLMNAI